MSPDNLQNCIKWHYKLSVFVCVAGRVGGGGYGCAGSLWCLYGWRSKERDRCPEGFSSGSKSCLHWPASAVGPCLSGEAWHSSTVSFCLKQEEALTGLLTLGSRQHTQNFDLNIHWLNSNNNNLFKHYKKKKISVHHTMMNKDETKSVALLQQAT